MFFDVNYISIIIAAVSGMAIGALWYSPLLYGKMWIALQGWNEKNAKDAQKRAGRGYILGFISTLIMSYVLAYFIDIAGAVTFGEGMVVSFWIWLGFVSTILFGGTIWEGEPLKLYYINISYWLVTLVIMGGLLAILR